MDDIIPEEIPQEIIVDEIPQETVVQETIVQETIVPLIVNKPTIEPIKPEPPKKVVTLEELIISTQKIIDIKKSNTLGNIERLTNRKLLETNTDEIERLQSLINLQESELININKTDVNKIAQEKLDKKNTF
jgi:hypothetical protein